VSTREIGLQAESRAEHELVRLGYRILERNYRARRGELDLVADDAGVLCFVEVRSRGRTDLGRPEETIGPEKRRRIALAAEEWLIAHPDPRGEDRFCRFDVVAVDDEGITLFRDAFRLDGASY
jgi:putative endonuclease